VCLLVELTMVSISWINSSEYDFAHMVPAVLEMFCAGLGFAGANAHFSLQRTSKLLLPIMGLYIYAKGVFSTARSVFTGISPKYGYILGCWQVFSQIMLLISGLIGLCVYI